MLARVQILAARWALTAVAFAILTSLSLPNAAWAQSAHPAQQAITAANAEEASEAEADLAKQSLGSLIAPIVRGAVQAELKTAMTTKSAGDSMDQITVRTLLQT